MQSQKFIISIFNILFFILLISSPLLAQPQLLLDMRTGEVLYEKEAGEAWFPASLTKMMTAYVVFEAISNERLTLKTPVIISSSAKKASGSKSGLPVDSAITITDALYLIIVKSANDVAIALAETISGSQAAFVIEMNKTAKRLGMSNSNFVNPNGLPNKAQVTTARDLAILALSIRAHYPQYNSLFSTYEVKLGEKIMQSYNNLLVDFLGANGMKTGFICSAGFNIVATANRGNKSLMVVILGASSKRERGEMAAQLLLKGFSGELSGTKKNIVKISNRFDKVAKDMRPQICGAQANDYVAQRNREFPFGLSGQPSFLKDNIIGKRVEIIPLGRMRNVALPRPRPMR